MEPEEVEEVLLVTAITFAFPFLPAALCWPPYLFPMMGVYTETNASADSMLPHERHLQKLNVNVSSMKCSANIQESRLTKL